MAYRIERTALQAFVARQVLLIESTPLPPAVLGLLRDGDDLGADEAQAVWLGAGLATQVGLAILNEPERFVVPTRAGRRAPA
jgi:hypothetical protein